MRRRKKLTIRVVALGFAAAAIAASPAQARVDEGLGMSKQSEPVFAVSPDDRNVNLMTYGEHTAVVSPDDRGFARSESPAAPTAIATDDGFELGRLGISGLVLLLGAAALVITVQQTRRSGLAST